MSLPEVLLWRALRLRPGGFKFRRQCPIDKYIIDFACIETRLVIEVDGEAHNRGNRPQRDEVRDADLQRLGFRILRVAAADVLSGPNNVVEGIVITCRKLGPLHHPAAPGGPPPRSGEDF
ncbi:endonuclease domain-containing protein [Sphingomonas sp. MMS24-J13]|uniref:endonuclease domain-containing protein n=1 Tax=Sphingomonas sp. MMS24-J13 TaxID=3238686 RepID=UPI00384A9BAA